MSGREKQARLSDKRSGVICLAKLEISLIKVVRTVVWETMVAPPALETTADRQKFAPKVERGEGYFENGGGGRPRSRRERGLRVETRRAPGFRF